MTKETTDYLQLGKGEVHFAPFKAGTQTPGAFRFFGNCPEFTFSLESEKLPHYKSTKGVKTKDKDIVIESTVSGNIQTDDMRPRNLGYFFLGDASKVTTIAETGLTEVLSDVEIEGSFQLGVTAVKPTGDRMITNLVVTDGGATTYVLDTDYELDADRGWLTVKEEGSISDGDDLTVTYNTQASSRDQVISGELQTEGAMKFIAYNPSGKNIDYYLPYVSLASEGDLGLISEEWATATFAVEALTLGDLKAVYADGQPVV